MNKMNGLYLKESFPHLRLRAKKIIGVHRRNHYPNGRIVHDYKCIFIHIPKTAGNSVTRALAALPQKQSNLSPKIGKHAKAYEVKYLLGEAIWNEYFTFAFVRNPWDLMVSSYHWWLQKAGRLSTRYQRHARRIQKMDGFNAFIQSHYGQKMINERHGDIFDWISEDGNIIVDFVGKVETLQQDWKKICRQIGVEAADIGHINKTNGLD
ncbi:MAG: hypothetical protein GF313_16590, partial [Caldithrix sp.]|nr:hypothetical protein [Caldithrix sp.]